MAPILVDTNLLIYLYDHVQPSRQQQAQRVLDQLELNRSGRLSVQNLAEFFSVATRKLNPPLEPAEALHQVTILARLWPVFDLTPMVVLEAGRGVREYQLSYYDAQIWATARLNQVPTIFSEDFQDGISLEGVQVVNPFSSQFVLESWV